MEIILSIIVVLYLLIGLLFFGRFYMESSQEYEEEIYFKYLKEFGSEPSYLFMCLMYTGTFVVTVLFWGPSITYRVFKKHTSYKNRIKKKG